MMREADAEDTVARILEGCPSLLSRPETAKLLRCRREQVDALIRQKELQAFQRRAGRKGSPVFISRDSLATYLRKAAL